MSELYELMPPERGATVREICPRCGGGSSRERSLSLTLTDQGYLLWNCHRASCGFRGKKPVWGVIELADRAAPKKQPKVFQGELTALPSPALQWFKEQFDLNPEDLRDWKFAPEKNRISIPYFALNGKFRGMILREWREKLEPRNLVYKYAADEPFIGWVHPNPLQVPVIVEDAISAAKVASAGFTALSLCGTNLSQTMVREIREVYPVAILALDADATGKAVSYAGTFRHLLGLTVWYLEKDLKYVSRKRIQDAYYDGQTDFRIPPKDWRV